MPTAASIPESSKPKHWSFWTHPDGRSSSPPFPKGRWSHGSAAWSASSMPVPGPFPSSSCPSGGGWLQCHIAMAQVGTPGLLDTCCGSMAAEAEMRARGGVLPGWQGDMGRGLWGFFARMCSSSPPLPWFRVPPWAYWLPQSNSLCLGTPLPSVADPGVQLSKNLLCLESNQIFFLAQTCSNCPKSTRQLHHQEDQRRHPTSSTGSTIGKSSSTTNPFPSADIRTLLWAANARDQTSACFSQETNTT